jgi:membrane protease YdiL (CAAX protease family)
MLLSFLLLTLAIVALWLPTRTYLAHSWWVLAGIAILSALYFRQLEVIALLPISLLAVTSLLYARITGAWRWLAGIALIGVSLGLGLHLFPGFYPLIIVDQVQLAPDSLSYTLRFNLDKPLIGLFILALLYPRRLKTQGNGVWLLQLLPIAVVTWGVVLLVSLLSGYIQFDYKVPVFILYWLWANLFFTCVAEEAIFRGFLQRQLALQLSKWPYGGIIAVSISALLFGVAHVGGGFNYVVLATIAGLGYGWAYQRTQRIEASILLHFSLNSIHILFFSYPALG